MHAYVLYANAGPVTAQAWHPSGHLLAAAVHHRPGFTILDVASGLSTPVSAGAVLRSFSRPSCAVVRQKQCEPVSQAC